MSYYLCDSYIITHFSIMKYLNKFKTYNDYLNHLDENTPVDCVNLENNNVHYSTLYKFDSDELCFYNFNNEKKR